MYSITIMMGRLVENPDLRHTPGDIAVCPFRIAVDRSYKVDGERRADFFNVVAWRGLAEFVCKYFKKGKPILVTGHFENRSYLDNDDNKRYCTELIAERISFAGDSSDKSNPPLPNPPPEQSSKADTEGFEEVSADDDLPF